MKILHNLRFKKSLDPIIITEFYGNCQNISPFDVLFLFLVNIDLPGYNTSNKPLYYLFFCMELIIPLENFSLIQIRHHYRWMAAKIDLYSAHTAIEQWGFFSVPHLLWHGTSNFMVISKDPWHAHLALSRAFGSGAVTTCLKRLRSVTAGIWTPNIVLHNTLVVVFSGL